MPNDLIPQPNDARLSEGLCSPGLKRLLTEGEDAGGACRLISLNKVLRAEAERVLPMMVAAKAPAAEAEILEILIRNAPAYSVNKPADGWMFLFGAYLDALEGLPAYAIEDAFLRWNRGEGHSNLQMASFYPKPGQLVQLAQKGKSELYMAAYRAEKALAYAERKEAAQPPAPEERKAVAADLAALAASMKMRAPADPFRPKISPGQMAQQIRAQAEAPKSAAALPGDDAEDVV